MLERFKHVVENRECKINLKSLKDHDKSLYWYVQGKGIRNLLKEIGYTDFEIVEEFDFKVSQDYTERYIEEKLWDMYKKNLPIHSLEISKNKHLHSLIGSNGGLKYYLDKLPISKKEKDYFGKDKSYYKREIKMLNNLKSRISDGEKVDYKAIRKDDRALSDQLEKHGGIRINIMKLGYSKEEADNMMIIKDHHLLTEEETFRRLKVLKDNNKLSTHFVRVYFDDYKLQSTLKKYFGSVSKGISHYGFKKDLRYERNFNQLRTYFSYGNMFEIIMNEVFEKIGLDFKYNEWYEQAKTRPDFQFPNSIWVDTKLSSYTVKNDRTDKKYSNKCNKLIILYLRENGKYYRGFNNVEYIKVNELFPIMEDYDLDEYVKELKSIEEEVNNLESATTERSNPSKSSDLRDKLQSDHARITS